MFAKLSSIISCAKAGEVLASEEPFGGLNVILVGNFYQFPTMATKPSAALYCPCNPEKDTHNNLLGRKLYKQFNTIVCLKTQVRVTHPEWLELLQHVHHGNCDERHIVMLRQFIVTHDDCPPTNFTTPPWKDVLLVTLRHVV